MHQLAAERYLDNFGTMERGIVAAGKVERPALDDRCILLRALSCFFAVAQCPTLRLQQTRSTLDCSHEYPSGL